MEFIINYFNLNPTPPAPPEVGAETLAAALPTLSVEWQVYIYLALLAGILANNFLRLTREGDGCFTSIRMFIISAIIGVVLLPTAYKQAQLNQAQPTVVQLAIIFATGMGYENLLASVTGIGFT